MSGLGNKEIMAQNIQRLMEKHCKDRNDICRDLGFKYTTFTDWINGNTYPRIDKIELMANYFNVSKSELVEAYTDSHQSQAVVVPVLGRVAAGIPLTAAEYIIDTEEISQAMASDGEYFGLQVKGDSMEPKISNGDVVIVRKQSDADDGDLVIALVNGDDAVVKRLKKYKDGIALISNNPAYDPMYFSNAEIESLPVEIIGKVKELRAKF